MRSLLLLGTLALSLPMAMAQNPGAAAAKMKTDAVNDRIRNQPVPVTNGDSALKQQQLAQKAQEMAQVQEKTEELNRLVQSLDGDMTKLKNGVIAADLNQKLKRIEKLAKEIRRALE